jgi:hypothetical protein
MVLLYNLTNCITPRYQSAYSLGSKRSWRPSTSFETTTEESFRSLESYALLLVRFCKHAKIATPNIGFATAFFVSISSPMPCV